MKNVKKLLIFVAISTFVFASWDRTSVLGGAGYWADDYSNIAKYPAALNNHSVSYTDGTDFTTIFDKDGTTWGFTGGNGDDTFDLTLTPNTGQTARETITDYTSAGDVVGDIIKMIEKDVVRSSIVKRLPHQNYLNLLYMVVIFQP